MNLAIIAHQHLLEHLIKQLNESDLDIWQLQAVILDQNHDDCADEISLPLCHDREVLLRTFDHLDLEHTEYLLWLGGSNEIAQVEVVRNHGCTIIDLNGTFGSISDIPVVVPAVNDQMIEHIRNHNIISLADPSISLMSLTLAPLLNEPLSQIFVSSLHSQAYWGNAQLKTFALQNVHLLNGLGIEEEDRLAFDVSPLKSAHNGAIKRNLALEAAKVMPHLFKALRMHHIQVPTFYGLSQNILVQSQSPLDLEYLSVRWQEMDNITFTKERLISAAHNLNSQENVLAISNLKAHDDYEISLWATADEQQYLTAFLGISLLEKVIRQ